jgi:1-acyl-sn-glycerol-3-phosphate acyltransferase
MQALVSLWSWFAIGVVVIAGFCVQAVLAVVTLPFDRRRYVCGRFFRVIGVVAARMVPSWSFGVAGEVPRSIAGRTVVVSNHASQADPFLISSLPWEMKWLGKEALFKLPVVGWSMWLAGDIPIRRGNARSADEAMRQCARWLDRGVPVMIFPEGTRSLDGALLPFKDGAFRLALDADAQLLPIAVEGTREALPKHSWHFGKARARVAVGTPIAARGHSIDELKDLARAQIEALRRSLR